ncbi:MAG: acyl-CoA thioesterase [Bacteriovoracaceae bacterium]|nr:acyl-CoA thioesterase [Bacteriovoracaceae bacterium]
MKSKGKKASDSAVEMRELVMPHHSNPQNTIFGGVIMSWIDLAASMCSSRHARRPVVTVHIGDITFKAPVKVGYHVLIKAKILYVGTTSLTVGVSVHSENPITGESLTTTTATVTMVAVDDHGKPCPVPPLLPQSSAEKKIFSKVSKKNIRRK